MSKRETSLHRFIQSTGNEIWNEQRQRRAAIAVLQARLDKAGIPKLDADEEQAIRLAIMQAPEPDPADLPAPTLVPARRRTQKGRL